VDLLAGRGVERLTFFFGAGLTEAQARPLLEPLIAAHPRITFELRDGGQPHAQFIVSAE